MNDFENKESQDLENSLGYIFKDKALLQSALTHLSYYEGVTEKIDKTGERLEYLGDAILGFLIKEYLFFEFPERDEGGLTLISSYLLSDKNLAKWSLALSIDKFILLGKGEEKQHGREKVSILAHTFEALIAAIYLDGGIRAIKHILFSKLLDREYIVSLLK